MMDDEEVARETQLARVEWLMEQAALWNERDPEFADLLRTKARRIQTAEDEKPNLPGRRLLA